MFSMYWPREPEQVVEPLGASVSSSVKWGHDSCEVYLAECLKTLTLTRWLQTPSWQCPPAGPPMTILSPSRWPSVSPHEVCPAATRPANGHSYDFFFFFVKLTNSDMEND